jgi:hypothetical protein
MNILHLSSGDQVYALVSLHNTSLAFYVTGIRETLLKLSSPQGQKQKLAKQLPYAEDMQITKNGLSTLNFVLLQILV